GLPASVMASWVLRTERGSVLRFLVVTAAWAGALAVYADALFDLLASAPPPSANTFAMIVSNFSEAVTRAALPLYWLGVFGLALALTRILLAQRVRLTLRWLGQAWLGTFLSYVAGFAALPRGLVLIDVFLLCLSAEGIRIGSTALARRLSPESPVQAT